MFSTGYTITVPPMVSVFTRGIGWVDESFSVSVPASGTFESANLAVYMPITLAAPCVIRRIWWANGATAAGNVDCGLYYDSGSRSPGAKVISSTSTAQSGANAVQFVDVTDTAIAPGLYWVAITSDSASTTFFRSALTAAAMDVAQRMQEASASPLPATATPVASTGTNIYLCGFSTTASP